MKITFKPDNYQDIIYFDLSSLYREDKETLLNALLDKVRIGCDKDIDFTIKVNRNPEEFLKNPEETK